MTNLGADQTTALRRLLIETVERPVSRPKPRRGLIVGLVAAPIATALIVSAVVLAPDPSRAEAAEVLRDAADRAITVSDPFVGPGQYLKITTEAAYLAYEVDADGNYTAYLSPNVTEVFVPADDGVEWVQRVTAEPAERFYGAASRAAAARDWASTLEAGLVQVTRDPAGDFVHAAELGGDVPTRALPDDPAEALAFLHKLPYGDGTDIGALSYAAQLLRTGTLPAEDRSTLYRALALVPDIRITDHNATLDGRTGIAFSLESDTTTPEIIVDPTNGQFIGERSLTPAAQGAIPAHTAESYTAVTTTVVDEAP
jgi:hypothetical protein